MSPRLLAIQTLDADLELCAGAIEASRLQIERARACGRTPHPDDLRVLSEILRLQAAAAQTLETYRCMSDEEFDRKVPAGSREPAPEPVGP